MDLSLPIAAGIAYFAYTFSQKQDRTDKSKRNTVSKNEKFNGKNVYECTRFDEVNNLIKNKADKAFEDSKDFKKTNRIPPFMNSLCTTEDCEFKGTPVATKTSILPQTNGIKKVQKKVKFDEIIEASEQKGLPGSQVEVNKPVSLLTGEPIELEHNNMVPFFRGEVKQNINKESTAGLVERFTGKLDTPTLKKETKSMFDKKPENIYGTPLFTNEISRDRFYQSGIKNNVTPTPQLRVKPLPEEVVRPIFKNVDTLRSKTNPKNTYEGRIIDGRSQAATTRGIEGTFNKNRPDRDYKNDSGRYFTGSYINGATARDNFENLQDTNRSQEELYVSPAGKLVSSNQFQLSREDGDFNTISSEPLRSNFTNEPFRNFDGQGEGVTDYGKCSFIIPPNERDTTNKQHILNVSNSSYGNYLYNADEAKTTQKELNLHQYTGNVRPGVENTTVRSNYNNYKASLKEETLYQNDYQPGRQNQTDTIGKTDLYLTTCKNNDTYDNYKSHGNPTYNSFNNDCGDETTNNLRCITEKDQTERIGSVFIKSLETNPYELKRTFK